MALFGFSIFLLVIILFCGFFIISLAPRKSEHYHRLPGGSHFWMSVRTLWRGRDHLMAVATTLVSESYRRFYFKDIQAVIIRRTRTFVWRMVLLGLLLFFPAQSGIRAMFGAGGNEYMLFPAVVLGVVLLHHLWLGPSCVMHIQTTAGKEPVPAVTRIRHARRIMDEIEPLILYVQQSEEKMETGPP